MDIYKAQMRNEKNVEDRFLSNSGRIYRERNSIKSKCNHGLETMAYTVFDITKALLQNVFR